MDTSGISTVAGMLTGLAILGAVGFIWLGVLKPRNYGLIFLGIVFAICAVIIPVGVDKMLEGMVQ